MAQSLRIGDKAPNFALFSQSGEAVELQDYIGSKPIVLFFYPKNNTSICTKEVCYFRDNFEEFRKLNDAELIGISADSVESHKQFSEEHDLPFTLLSDPDNDVRNEYGVPKTLGLLPGRVTYIIDKQGIVRHIYSSQLNYKAHVKESISFLKSIS